MHYTAEMDPDWGWMLADIFIFSIFVAGLLLAFFYRERIRRDFVRFNAMTRTNEQARRINRFVHAHPDPSEQHRTDMRNMIHIFARRTLAYTHACNRL